MEAHEFSTLLQLVGSAGAGAAMGVVIGSLLLRGYLLPYLEVKAKTLAETEDLAALKRITEELKGVEHRYAEALKAVEHRNAEQLKRLEHSQAELLESTKLRNQLQVAALDRRLQVHQEAYALCRHFVTIAQGVKTDEAGAALASFQSWWSGHCLYLTTAAASALYTAYGYAPRFKHIERTRREDEAAEIWEKIISAQSTIAREAGILVDPATHLVQAAGQ